MTAAGLVLLLLAAARSAPLPDSLAPSSAVESPLKAIQEDSDTNKLMSSLKNLLNHINQRIPDKNLENIKCDLIVPNSNESDGFIFKYLKGKLYPGKTPVYSDKKGENVGPRKYMEIHFIDNSHLNSGNQLVIKLPDTLSPYSQEPDKHNLGTMPNNENISGTNINKRKGVDEANSSTTGSSERYISSSEKPVSLHNVTTGVHMNGANNHSRNENVSIKEIQENSSNSIIFEATTHPFLTDDGFLNGSNGLESQISSETYIDESSLVTGHSLNNTFIKNSTNLSINVKNHLFSNKTSIYSDSGSTTEGTPTLYSVSQMQTTRSEVGKESAVISEGTVDFSTIVNTSESEVTYPMVNNYTQDYDSETSKSSNRELEYTNGLGKTVNILIEPESTSDLPYLFSNTAEEGLLKKSTKLFNTESEDTSAVPLSTFNKDNNDRMKKIISFSLKNGSKDVLPITKSPITESDYTSDLLSSSMKNDYQDQLSEATKLFNTESEFTPGFTPSFENNNSQSQQTETSDNNPGLSSSLLNNNQDQNDSTDSIHSESEFAQKLSSVLFTNDNQDQMRKTTEPFNIESKDIPELTSVSLDNDNQVQMTKENGPLNTDSEYTATQSLSLTSLNTDNTYYHSEATRSFNTELANTSGFSLSPDSNDSQDQQSETTKLFNIQSNDTSDLDSSSFINNQDFQTKETKSLITESEFTLPSSPVSKDNQYIQGASTEPFNTVSENTTGLSSPLINNNDHQYELTKSTKSLNTDSEYSEDYSLPLLNNKNLNLTESSSLFNTESGNTPYISLASPKNATQDQHKKTTKSFSIESEDATGLTSSPINNDNQYQLTRNTNPMDKESEYTQNLPSSSLNYDTQDHLSDVTKLFNTESGDTLSLATFMNDYNQDQSEESTKAFSTETDESSHFSSYYSTYEKPYTYIETTKSSIINNVSNRPSSIIPNKDFFNGTTLHSDTLNTETIQPTNLTPAMNHNEYDQPNETTNPSNMNSFTSTTEIHLLMDYKKTSGTTKFSTSEKPAITNMFEGSTDISLEETYAKESTHLLHSSLSNKQNGIVTSTTPSPQTNSDILGTTTELMSPSALDNYHVNLTTILTSATTGLTEKWITPASEGYLSVSTSNKVMDNINSVETEVSQLKETTIPYDVNNSSESQTVINSNTVTINPSSENMKEYIESTEKIDPHKAYKIEHTSATHLEDITSQLEAITINSFEITTENTHNSNTLIYTSNVPSSVGKIPPAYSERVNNSKSLKSGQNLTISSRDIYDEEYTTKNYTLLGAMTMRNKKKSTPSTLDGYSEITTITNEHFTQELESSTISELTTNKAEEYKPTLNQSDKSEYMTSTQFTLSNSEYSVPFSTTLETLSKVPEDSDSGENELNQYFNNNQTEAFDRLGNETTSTESTNQYDTLSTSSLLIHSSKQNNSLNRANITTIHREGKLLEMDPTIETISTLDVTLSEYLVTTQISIETSGSEDKETFESHSSSVTKSMDVTSPFFITENKNTINSENLKSTTEGHASIIPNSDEDVNHTTNYPSTMEVANTNIQSSNSITMSKPTRGPRLLPTKEENTEVPSFNSTISSIPNIYQTRTTVDPNPHHYTKLLNINDNLSSSDLSDLSYNNNNQPVIEYPQYITSTTPQYSIESDFNNFTFYVPTTEHLTLYVPAKISFRAITKFT